ncbi:MAG: VWA domain-containing protein [Thermoanaerobaculia bacterium]|nr:MAG: VWA domain-containing protein [Thermoanaerobaculia bacterium]
MPIRPRLLALLLVLAAVLPGAAPAATDEPSKAQLRAAEQALPEVYRVWLLEVAPLITEAERRTFLALEKDYQRDAFIERFWQVRDPYPDTARNELRETWSARLEEARQTFGDLDDERARMFLLNGAPDVREVDTCGVRLWPTEVWIYSPGPRLRETFGAVFHKRFGQGKWRLWQPTDGVAALFQAPPPSATPQSLLAELEAACVRSQSFAGVISWVLRQGPLGYGTLLHKALKPIEAPSREWVGTFNSYSTDLPEEAARIPGELSVAFPGRRQSRTVVQATVALPVAEVGAAEFGGARSYDFLLNGEILLGGRLFESFRYKFDLAAADVTSPAIPLVFERFLRPGEKYRLVVKVEDLNGKRYFRADRELQVPAIEGEPAPPSDEETERLLAEANAALSTLDNTIRILRPAGEMQAGLVRFDTLSTGAAISEVQFALDGRPILRKNRPPFSVELDLGEVPRTRTLTATAYDANGRELASDEAQLNTSAHRFGVRLIEPRRGRRYEASLRAEAEVEVPEDATLERVEFFLNETPVATLYQPPFTQPLVLPPKEQVAYVRVVAHLADGNSTEDLVFVNAPEGLEEMEVQFVELYTTVVDRDQRPVTGLPVEAFRVAEDGVPQTLARFEPLENLPIHVAVLLDTSASMEPSLDLARAAALRFFEEAIRARDRAALVPFNDRPHLAVRMTNRLTELAGGLAGLKAERGTSIYDSVVFALFYFNGLKGQRALLVLSDGKDENSRFTFDQTLDFARRAGVAIYTIGLDIPRSQFDTRKVLKTLADETGGRSFFVKSAEELGPVYSAVQQELRSRYLLAYQSGNAARDLKFRTVEVQVDRPGLEAKTMRGYYP